MAEQKGVFFPTDADTNSSKCCLDDFARFVEKNADAMERTGWLGDAVQMRKWASELRGRSIRSAYATDIVARLRS